MLRRVVARLGLLIGFFLTVPAAGREKFSERARGAARIHPMNTRSLWLSEKFDACGDRLRRILAGVFGRPSWSPPAWLRHSWERFDRFNQARPHLTSGIVLAVLLLIYGATWTWHWYKT